MWRRVPEDCPQGVVDLWQACIAIEPGARPTAAEVQAALEELLPIPRPSQAKAPAAEEKQPSPLRRKPIAARVSDSASSALKANRQP